MSETGQPVVFNDGPVVFADGKAPDAMRTIGEVAAALGIRQHVLRYWEEQFPTLRPLKRGGGRRYYRPEDVALVATIDRLVHRDGYTLRGARLAIAGGGVAAPVAAKTGVGESGMVPQLQAIRDGLAAALAVD
jgi:DNA-binding transcriptional MerR regulator